MTIWKRSGWLALCLLVALVSIIMQVFGMLAGMIQFCIQEMRELNEQGLLTDAIVNEIMTRASTDGMGPILLWSHIFMVVCFAIWFYFGCGRPKIRQAKVVFVPKNLLVLVLVAVGMCFFSNFGLSVATLIIPESILENYEALMELAGFGVDTLAIIASVFLAPFGEEFMCRGVVFHYAKKMVEDLDNRRKAFWIANTVQALIFGLIHANIIQGSYAFLMGLALGYLRHRYNSLAPAILAHMVFNATSTFLLEPFAELLPESYVLYAVIAFVFLAVAFVGFRMGGKVEQETAAVAVAEEA